MPNRITVRSNGPIVAQGELRLEDANGNLLEHTDELYLCRCGNTKSSPYCDGSHKNSEVELIDQFSDEKSEPLDDDGPLVISVRPNAMLIAKGPMVIEGSDSGSHTTRNKAALCRCGHSKNKPFCDASHKRCGFTDPPGS
jgi:CDGSH-type Zn-finger protein